MVNVAMSARRRPPPPRRLGASSRRRSTRPRAPVRASATSTATKVRGTRMFSGGQQDGQHGQDRAEREGDGRGKGGVPGADDVRLVDVQLGRKVGAQGIVRGQFPGHRCRAVSALRPLPVDRREFLELLLRFLGQFPRSFSISRLLAVPLAADGDVLAQGHGDGAAHHARGTRREDGARFAGGTGDTHHDRRHRHDAVVGAEDARAQPVQPVDDVVVVGLILVLRRVRRLFPLNAILQQTTGSAATHRLRKFPAGTRCGLRRHPADAGLLPGSPCRSLAPPGGVGAGAVWSGRCQEPGRGRTPQRWPACGGRGAEMAQCRVAPSLRATRSPYTGRVPPPRWPSRRRAVQERRAQRVAGPAAGQGRNGHGSSASASATSASWPASSCEPARRRRLPAGSAPPDSHRRSPPRSYHCHASGRPGRGSQPRVSGRRAARVPAGRGSCGAAADPAPADVPEGGAAAAGRGCRRRPRAGGQRGCLKQLGGAHGGQQPCHPPSAFPRQRGAACRWRTGRPPAGRGRPPGPPPRPREPPGWPQPWAAVADCPGKRRPEHRRVRHRPDGRRALAWVVSKVTVRDRAAAGPPDAAAGKLPGRRPAAAWFQPAPRPLPARRTAVRRAPEASRESARNRGSGQGAVKRRRRTGNSVRGLLFPGVVFHNRPCCHAGRELRCTTPAGKWLR